MSNYSVSYEEVKKTDISGVLANRDLIEASGLDEFCWEVTDENRDPYSDLSEVCRFLRRLLKEWPEILRYCGEESRGMFIYAACKQEGWTGAGPLLVPTPLFKRALKRAGLNEDFSPRKNKRKA